MLTLYNGELMLCAATQGKEGYLVPVVFFQEVMKTLQIHDEKQQYTTWLALWLQRNFRETF